MILLGLDFLHRRDILHRDLKPANIFLVELRNGKKILSIGDFGISTHNMDTIKQLNSTLRDRTTLLIKAPEAFEDKLPTSKVDIWALGSILYYLLS